MKSKNSEQFLGQEHPLHEEPIHLSADKSHKKSTGLDLLAQVSTLSWNLVLPIVGGVLLGAYLDKRADGDLMWTLSLLVLGVLISLSNLYNLYIEHGRGQIEPPQAKEDVTRNEKA
jgi:F0F1-type ATP synthase assembly protein I